MGSRLTLGSLFDGSGGFPLAGLLSGIEPVWASEIEPFPIRVTTKRMPFVKHYGDVSQIRGQDIEPVDIITFGSPCQDMSVAGRRGGLDSERSGLFFEAIRIIKEMREATDGRHPRYIVWENVPGAFSSNKGEDFWSVLKEVAGIKGCEAYVPRSQKWEHAGLIVAEDLSIAWRLLDAQHWGVPQRRKRIYLVADLAGRSAGKVLFESEGVSGYSAESFRSWQRTAGRSEESTGETGKDSLISSAGFCTEHSAKSQGIGYEEEISPTLRAGTVPAAISLEHNPSDARLKVSSGDKVQTLLSRMGTGGNNVPLIMMNPMKEPPLTYGIDRAAFNQGRNAKYSFSVEEEKEPPIVARGPGAVAEPTYSASKASFFTSAGEEVAGALVATDYKDPPLVNDMDGWEYIVRRLTPTECARLQGFPDWWCSDLGTEDPTEEEMKFWTDVFETHRRVVTHAAKPKSDVQIRKWLRDPHTDSAEYKMWGNGIALPNAVFVLAGIVWAEAI